MKPPKCLFLKKKLDSFRALKMSFWGENVETLCSLW